MKVQITKEEGHKPYVCVTASEIIYQVETIDEWVRQLRIARAWLVKKAKK